MGMSKEVRDKINDLFMSFSYVLENTGDEDIDKSMRDMRKEMIRPYTDQIIKLFEEENHNWMNITINANNKLQSALIKKNAKLQGTIVKIHKEYEGVDKEIDALQTEVDTLQDRIKELEKVLQCPNCGGSGKVIDMTKLHDCDEKQPCKTCHGTGQKVKKCPDCFEGAIPTMPDGEPELHRECKGKGYIPLTLEEYIKELENGNISESLIKPRSEQMKSCLVTKTGVQMEWKKSQLNPEEINERIVKHYKEYIEKGKQLRDYINKALEDKNRRVK